MGLEAAVSDPAEGQRTVGAERCPGAAAACSISVRQHKGGGRYGWGRGFPGALGLLSHHPGSPSQEATQTKACLFAAIAHSLP